jgi:hypothetical protein
MKKIKTIASGLLLFLVLQIKAQIPSTPYKCLQSTCTPNNTYNMISVDIINECGARLNGYPFTIKYNQIGGGVLKFYNGNIATNGGVSVTTCCTAGTWGWKVVDGGAASYTIQPGYSSDTWRGVYYGLCCPIDTLPGYSPDPSVNLNFSTSSPTSSTYSGNFSTAPKFTFTVTNPYAPSYTVQGKSLDMNHTEIIAKCGANSITLTNNTNTFGTTVQYFLKVYNSDASKTQGTVLYQSPSWGTLQSILDASSGALASAVNGNYYIIEVSVRCNGSNGTGSYVRGHLKYVVPSTPTASFNINSTTVPTTCTTPREVFNCNAITLNNTSNSDAIQYQIELLSSTSNCGTYTSVYNSGYLSAFPTDLKNLPGTNGTWLQNNTGFFQVKLTTKNACGTVGTPYIGYIKVATGPSNANAAFKTNCITKATQTITIGSCTVPVNTQFSYMDGSTGCSTGNYKFPMEHSSISTPNEVGRNNTIFDFSTVSAGTGSIVYSVTLKTEQWDGTTWQVMNYNGVPEVITGLTTMSLNALLDDDPVNNPNYMAFTDPSLTPDGSIYRITVSVNNECGSYTNSQIIKLNTIKMKRMSNPELDNEIKLKDDLTVYPNPFTNLLNIELPTTKENTRVYQLIEILDVTGKILVTKSIGSTDDKIIINTEDMPSGIYFYAIKSDMYIVNGKIIKN